MLPREQLDALLERRTRLGLFVLLEAFDESDIELMHAARPDAGWRIEASGAELLAGLNCRDLTTLQIVPRAARSTLAALAADAGAARSRKRCGHRGGRASRGRGGLRLALVGSALMQGGDPGALACRDAEAPDVRGAPEGEPTVMMDQDLRHDDAGSGERRARCRRGRDRLRVRAVGRQLTPAAAHALAAPARGRVLCVAVTRHPTQEAIDEIVAEFRPDVLQTDHDDLRDCGCRAAGAAAGAAASCRPADTSLPPRLLFEGPASGSGRTVRLDGRARRLASRAELVLAGGLNADQRRGRHRRRCEPFGVDVSSGVESTPGSRVRLEIARFRGSGARADTGAPIEEIA